MARLRSLALTFTTVMLLGGCEKPADKPADATDNGPGTKADKKADGPPVAQPKPDEAKPNRRLTVGPGLIMPKGQPNHAVELTADGTIKFSATPNTLSLSSEGKVNKPDGTLVAEVGEDGAVKIENKASGITLNDHGLVLVAPDGRTVTMNFHESGVVQMEPPPGPDMQMVFEGCDGPVAKSCALVLSLYLLLNNGESDSAAAHPPATPDTAG